MIPFLGKIKAFYLVYSFQTCPIVIQEGDWVPIFLAPFLCAGLISPPFVKNKMRHRNIFSFGMKALIFRDGALSYYVIYSPIKVWLKRTRHSLPLNISGTLMVGMIATATTISSKLIEKRNSHFIPLSSIRIARVQLGGIDSQ